MSFREKSAWIALVTYGLVFGGYFLVLWRSWDEGYAHGLSVGLLAGAVVVLVLVATALTTIAALFNPREANAPADERERMIDLKAERTSSFVLSAGVVCVIGVLLLGMNSILAANLLLANLVVAELVKAINQIVYFRTGA